MSLKKDKEKVLGETFDDARIKSFLDTQAPKGVDADYHCLEIAYRGMHQENFATFVTFFSEAGRNFNALGPEGKTIAQTVAQHRQSGDYLKALSAAGAK
ncbi:PA4642 family protein [Marinagarivorans algicola]|uniref:PA4642 family protein n=1 Tax=Marinagarivorans algicola TaxID=1513270 RepID=UPI0006B57D18|nr:PA4642 family protein [Marinagarivorans algicola]